MLYSHSSLVRTSFGPRSELLRKTPEQGPNQVRTKEDGEWKESGTRLYSEKIKMTILKTTEINIEPIQNQKKWPGINSKPSSNQISTDNNNIFLKYLSVLHFKSTNNRQ